MKNEECPAAPTPIKMKSVTLLNKQEKPFTNRIEGKAGFRAVALQRPYY